MAPTDPPKTPTPRRGEPDLEGHSHEDTQPISRLALDAVEEDADGSAAEGDRTDTMHRGSLPFGAHSPDTEPNQRVAAAIDREVRGLAHIGPTIAPVRASYGIADVREHFARGDFGEAYALAEAILAYDSENKEAKSYATSCELRLRRRYAARLGSMRRVPRVVSAPASDASIDARGRLLLARVNGRATTEELLRASGLPEMEALRVFVALLDWGLVTFD